MPQGEEMDVSYFMAEELVPVSKTKICICVMGEDGK